MKRCFYKAFYFPLFVPLARGDVKVSCALVLVVAVSLGGPGAEAILIRRRTFLPPGAFGALQ